MLWFRLLRGGPQQPHAGKAIHVDSLQYRKCFRLHFRSYYSSPWRSQPGHHLPSQLSEQCLSIFQARPRQYFQSQRILEACLTARILAIQETGRIPEGP